MNSDLCVGIRSSNEVLEIAALESGRPAMTTTFPATAMGIEAIRGFLASYGNSPRLAVTGVAALSLALSLGNAPQYEVFIVSAAIADQPVALAQYAERAI